MGERNVELIEQNVKTNNEDIRDLKKRMYKVENEVRDVKNDHNLTKQSVTHVLQTLSELKDSFKNLDEKLDKDKEEQLKAYKDAVWKVGITVVGAVIGGFLLFSFGL
ncbi:MULTISPECIES: hypothetical protein [unclassified Oceanobacillus]|uniref:hypothetical protein n=1 Tax=unclassified Oceanobacillus TaxID=2630292 RepID=UPI001BE7FF0A|nr:MULTISPECIES: hypothetical protein [unclassified Oceanobacillus]MBT2600932.1 hypothetical protein [Oceanobacillus sp. ISL-74]MBT2653617.1 hypothetical protein [Oceanobacillus sp. ISL-73]